MRWSEVVVWGGGFGLPFALGADRLALNAEVVVSGCNFVTEGLKTAVWASFEESSAPY